MFQTITMYLVSNLTDVLPGPEPMNLTRTARVARTLAYRGDSLMGRMLTRGHPEHDLPVEVRTDTYDDVNAENGHIRNLMKDFQSPIRPKPDNLLYLFFSSGPS